MQDNIQSFKFTSLLAPVAVWCTTIAAGKMVT